METQTSLFDYLLLLNVPIPIELVSGDIINIKTPSLYEYYQNTSIRLLENLFMTALLELQMNPELFGFVADNYLDLMLGVKMTDEKNPLFKAFEDMTNTKITKQSITFNGVPLTEEDVDEVRIALLVSTGKMNVDGSFKEGIGEEDEQAKKLREAEEKIAALRKTSAKSEERISFKQMLMLIMYELNKTPEELYKMNFYGIYELYAVAGQAPYDDIQKIAAGNGNLPKGKDYKNILSK